MARKVVGIEAGRIDRLARQLGPELATAGYMSVPVDTVADGLPCDDAAGYCAVS